MDYRIRAAIELLHNYAKEKNPLYSDRIVVEVDATKRGKISTVTRAGSTTFLMHFNEKVNDPHE